MPSEMQFTPLDYEQTLSELQALVGTRVLASVQAAESEFMGATIMGPLRSAAGLDFAQLMPDLLENFAGESLSFSVVDPSQPAVIGSFSMWRTGFEWGRRVEQPHGVSVTYQVAGLRIFVRPAPSIPGFPPASG